ncbi:DUF4330 domain-containing protein [Peptoniphilus sp. AGMB00490]|uniref:DUF4330 domain-containing protein n=2 Tax=Peptoniphilus TaxID=162289 RepID=A0ACD6AZ26_9FIRM|nr:MULTISPECIES: DUF4330 domain-containing protein [Peptoniphilus]MDD7352213.1 DUF4330 domain-containing protein [Peptoniphilaceae bacterium]NMW85100.1 DUF4330 domain-containing protein [Peptoniphilus faecalis]OLR64457.1 hypothetical protein BIV18_02295 [Peptoniphilus porci]
MKIIDKKGRLFGLINIVDLLVIILILALVAVGVKRFGTKAAVGEASTKKGVITAEVKDVRDVTANNIKVGDKIFDYDKGTYLGKIVAAEVEPYKDKTEYQGKFYNSEVPGKYRVIMTIDADVKETEDFYQVGTEQIRIGAEMRIKNKNITTFMTILGIELKN